MIFWIWTNLVRMQHASIDPSTRFNTVGTHIGTNVPQFATPIVSRCINPFPFSVKSDLIHRGFVCFRIRKLHYYIIFNRQPLDFVFPILFRIIWMISSGENVIEFTGYKSLLQDIKNHFDFQLWIILILQSSLRMSSRDIPETDRCVISCWSQQNIPRSHDSWRISILSIPKFSQIILISPVVFPTFANSVSRGEIPTFSQLVVWSLDLIEMSIKSVSNAEGDEVPCDAMMKIALIGDSCTIMSLADSNL